MAVPAQLEWKGASGRYHDVQEVEAGAVARSSVSGRPRSPAIVRRSRWRRRPDDAEDARVDLGYGRGQKLVKTMRKEEINEGGEKEWRGDSGLHRKRSSSAAASGGTASSNPSSLGALGLWFLGQKREE